MESIWTKTAALPQFPPLEGNRKTDVLVIGGGITGILCAWMLRQAGADCSRRGRSSAGRHPLSRCIWARTSSQGTLNPAPWAQNTDAAGLSTSRSGSYPAAAITSSELWQGR